jgi:hypothetical protein
VAQTSEASDPADGPPGTTEPLDVARAWATARVEGSFRDIYLTLISIIQGMALAYLIETIGADYSRLNLDQVGRAVLVFLFIVAVWQEYLIGSVMYAWIPGMIDSAAPFLIGASQGLMIATITGSSSEFLFFATCAAAAGTIGGFNYAHHAKAQRMHTSRQSQRVVAAHPKWSFRMALAGSILLGCLWAYTLMPLRQPHPAIFPWLGSLVFVAFFVSMYLRWVRPMYGPKTLAGTDRDTAPAHDGENSSSALQAPSSKAVPAGADDIGD